MSYNKGLLYLLSIMFPTPSRENKSIMGIPYLSPLDRSQSNRLSQLYQFKKIPHSKFFSQERKRIQKFDLKQISNACRSPKNKYNHRGSFFKNSQPQMKQVSPKAIQQYKDGSSILKINKQSRNRKIYRYAQESNETKVRQNTDIGHNGNRQSTQTAQTKLQKNRSQQRQRSKSIQRLKPLDLLRSQHNLQQFQKQQLLLYNEIYYFGQNCPLKRSTLADYNKPDGGYNWLKGDHVYFRYQILQILGEGSFGQVYKCLDHKKNKLMALKIVKNNEKYNSQAKTEIKILNFIKAKDPMGVKNCIHIKQYFNFRGRMCMTFDLMSINLYELIKSNGYYGLPLDLIRRIALQVLNAIHFLHQNQIIHADLKPQNILLKQANKSGVKVIDFGSSCFQKQTIYTYIQSRYYRAPEVILGIPYDRKIDIWSFACIIAQLHLGYPLFAGEEEHQQMCLFIQVLGKPPHAMLQAAKRKQVFFEKNNQLKSHAKKTAQSSKPLAVALQNPNDEDFIDFLKSCFQWLPQKRAQAIDCLKHEWILKGLPQQIRKQHLRILNEQQQKKAHQVYQKNRSFSLNQHRNKLFS